MFELLISPKLEAATIYHDNLVQVIEYSNLVSINRSWQVVAAQLGPANGDRLITGGKAVDLRILAYSIKQTRLNPGI